MCHNCTFSIACPLHLELAFLSGILWCDDQYDSRLIGVTGKIWIQPLLCLEQNPDAIPCIPQLPLTIVLAPHVVKPLKHL